jgi:CDP-6-deoxy-D-xylo-4-hexulose-3-dehydrase
MLNSEFIFQFPAHNMRPTEITGLLGLSQLSRLDKNIQLRNRNFELFLKNLDSKYFFTEFETTGQSNYALIVILREPDFEKRDQLEKSLKENFVEFRRGLSGGGNQLRQPYLKSILANIDLAEFSEVEHVHHFAWYLGNYPELSTESVLRLTAILNEVFVQ